MKILAIQNAELCAYEPFLTIISQLDNSSSTKKSKIQSKWVKNEIYDLGDPISPKELQQRCNI